jgi:phosphinothricin acetyltransferase
MDAVGINAIYAPFVVGTTVSFETEPPSVSDMASRIEVNIETYGYLLQKVQA